MTLRTAPIRLADIHAPVRGRLDAVTDEIRRIVVSAFAPVDEVNPSLLKIRGKLSRPGLVLLCAQLEGGESRTAETLAAIIELVHLATLVHDDAVDHSVLRRGGAPLDAMWGHQGGGVLGGYPYSRPVSESGRPGGGGAG